MKGIWIYDIESLSNFFSYYAINRDTGEDRFYYIHENVNQLEDLINHLNNEVSIHIGFNNISYDYPMLHHILSNKIMFTAEDMYIKSQEIIQSEFSAIYQNNMIIQQVDLYLIKHYNNVARATSLKWLEFTQRWHKLQDMPFKHSDKITKKDISIIRDYNINDVLATKMFYEKHCKDDISFRKDLSEKFNHIMINYSDVKIGEYINRVNYENLSGRNYKDFKDKRTYRKIFDMMDIIPDIISFKSSNMQKFLNNLRNLKFKEEDNIDEHLIFGDTIVKFAKGGLHSEDIGRIVKCKPGYRLVEKDIASMYPWTIISDSIYPQHLGVEWNEGIKNSFNYRAFTLKPQLKKLSYDSVEYKKINSEQEAYKLSLNGGGFGKLGSSFSWQYDPLAKYKTTIGGELKMLMLIEDYYLADIDIVSVNTDGVVLHYPKEKQNLVDKIHDDWEKLTTYILENTYYKQIIFASVNDYIAEIIDINTGKTEKLKFKGDFEIDQEPHKNNSQRIVPIALKEYFINGIQPRDVIKNIGYKFINSKKKEEITTIYDYCIGKKKASNQSYHYVEKNKHTEIKDKVIRYYVVDSSKSQNKIFKEYLSGARAEKASGKALEAINKGFNHMLFMDYVEKEDYMINDLYYIQECMKIIEPIETNTRKLNAPKTEQLSLF